MKILIANDAGKSAHYFERLGLARAFSVSGHDCILWDTSKHSEYDAFDEHQPDLFIGQSYNLNNALINCISENPAIKVILKAGEWGESNIDVDNQKYPVLVATQQEIDNVKKLQEKTGKPDFLFIHYYPSYIDYTHGQWNTLGIQVHSIMNAADVFEYANGQAIDIYKSDLAYISGYWPYKAQVLDQWLLPLCSDFKHKIKIFGSSHWPVPQYMGYCPEGHEKNVYKSAKISINLHEPHSQKFGYDVNERFFKLAINKCFCISDYVEGQERLYSSWVYSAKTPEEFYDKINEMLLYWDKYDSFRKNYVDKAYEITLKENTYFDRASKIFSKLGLEDEAQNVLNQKLKIIEKLSL